MDKFRMIDGRLGNDLGPYTAQDILAGADELNNRYDFYGDKKPFDLVVRATDIFNLVTMEIVATLRAVTNERT